MSTVGLCCIQQLIITDLALLSVLSLSIYLLLYHFFLSISLPFPVSLSFLGLGSSKWLRPEVGFLFTQYRFPPIRLEIPGSSASTQANSSALLLSAPMKVASPSTSLGQNISSQCAHPVLGTGECVRGGREPTRTCRIRSKESTFPD